MASLQLHALGGSRQFAVHLLEKEQTVLGRSLDCDFVFPSVCFCVAKRHARIIRIDDQSFVEDLDSRGGTRVNGAAITGRTLLRSGDKICFTSDLFVQFQE